MRIHNVLLFPFLLDCSKHTTDPFWKYIFEDLACGKAPYGAFINKNFLCCNFKHKEFIYKLDETLPSEKLFNDIYSLLKTKLNIQSSIEQYEDSKIINKILNDNQFEFKQWSDIKKKSLKVFLIEEFVIYQKKKYKLSNRVMQELMSLIYLGLIFKNITSNDIIIKNNKIFSISGISFKNKKMVINYDIYHTKTLKKTEESKKETMVKKWVKYLDQLSSKIKV